MTEYASKGAEISADGKYRYRLWREWRGTHDPLNWRWLRDAKGEVCKDGEGKPMGEPRSVLFIMLNPSTADAYVDDPTIRRCVGYAKAWKYERMEVVNLFAYRATDPRELLKLGHDDDPVGVDNQRHVEMAVARAGFMVCAWGIHGSHLEQDKTMMGWITGWNKPITCLALTKTGMPRHPLRLHADWKPQPFVV